MEQSQIIELIIICLPQLVTALGVVISIFKLLKEIKNQKNEIDNLRTAEELKIQLKQVIDDNIKLKQLINELLTQMTNIRRRDNDKKI